MNKPIIKPVILVELNEGNCRGADSQGNDVFRREKKIMIKTYDDGVRIPICLHLGNPENPRCGLSESLLCKYHSPGA